MRGLFRLMQLFALIVTLSVTVSCIKKGGENEGGEDTPKVEAKGDWYAAGISFNMAKVATEATVWKNGEILYTNSEPESEAVALSVCVDGDNLYSSGFMECDRGDFNIVWKNGKELLSVDMYDKILSERYVRDGFIDVAVVGEDVYALANMHGTNGQTVMPVLFKNGTPQQFDVKSSYVEVVSIEASGSDLYAVGAIDIDNVCMPAVWKNGTMTTLELPKGAAEGYCYSVYIDGNDVYITGEVFSMVDNSEIPCVWKNGKAQILAMSVVADGLATGAVVKDSKLYVCGTIYGDDGDYACVWEDGKQSILGEGAALGIVDSKDGIIVGGYSYDPVDDLPVAIIWKDGKAEQLGIGMIVRMCQ